MKQWKVFVTTLALILLSYTAAGQCSHGINRMQWGATVGLNIGATAPLPIPQEITKTHAWYPNTNGVVALWGRVRFCSSPWGLLVGLESERKAFSATTSAVDLPIQIPGVDTAGPIPFTGLQNTELQTSYLTMPIMATFATKDERFILQMGLYHSLLLSGNFYVKVDGDGTIAGAPIAPEQILRFDFSDEVHAHDFGLRIGAEYFFTPKVGISARFNFGITPALKEEFRAIPSKMHHMYAMIGASYRFSS